MKAIINGKILFGESIAENKNIIFNEKIVGIVDCDKFDKTIYSEIIDAEGDYVSAGFIDIHIHGFAGADMMDATPDSLNNMSEALAKIGVTSFLPTTMTMDEEKIAEAIENVRNTMGKENGAEIIGVNMEGPYISEEYCGAHNKKYIQKPNMRIIDKYRDVIKIVTYAPENDLCDTFIKELNKIGIVGAIGHTGASYERVMSAFENGAKHVTHLFNAMEQFHHRKPGVTLAVLNSEAVCEIIADNIHIAKELYQTIVKLKGIDKIIVVSDSISAGGISDGQYRLGGQDINVIDGKATLENGTIAGSVVSINNSIKNILTHTDLKINEAIKMVTENPAKLLGIYHRKGSLDIGKEADIVIFDKEINVKRVIIRGKEINMY